MVGFIFGKTGMDAMELIYCAGGNKRFAQIAKDYGFFLGSQLPSTVYIKPIFFADQNWKKPNKEVYLACIRKYRPALATVLDWEYFPQLPEVLEWAEDVAALVDEVIVIPKVVGGIKLLPHTIGGKKIRLGYSVPTGHGSTSVPTWEFGNWPVHLLGGSPHKQVELSHYLNVVSADGNMAQKMAIRFNSFFYADKKAYKRGNWPSLVDADGEKWENDGPYESFRRSCENIMSLWQSISEVKKNG